MQIIPHVLVMLYALLVNVSPDTLEVYRGFHIYSGGEGEYPPPTPDFRQNLFRHAKTSQDSYKPSGAHKPTEAT